MFIGEACSDVEDPRRLKRDPGNGDRIVYRVQWNGRGLDVSKGRAPVKRKAG